jgi:uncharacterized protein YdiU (UPF0061 family)
MSTSPPILKLAGFLADPVSPADFPEHKIRFWNARWAGEVGLGDLDAAGQVAHFGRFEPLPGNLKQPLALRYHGHQFGTYNPQLGDGRGFLFAQLRDRQGRLLDLGTKGSGQTPWSRQGDGRLTLKGGVREILASSYLEALGVNTSKSFALVETGEQLTRNDEPSPTRSAVLTRLSHSHIRFGSFQRLAYLEERDSMAQLIDYCVTEFHPQAEDPDMAAKACKLLESIATATGRMIGQWMAAGFVHGVMNTDNFNITGETFDFGPWRFLPRSDPNFTAAYFDQQGLYRFGRQPVQGGWALQQLASALLLVGAEADDLAKALAPYQLAYRNSFIAHTHALLGIAPTGEDDADIDFLQTFYAWMTESEAVWPQVFHDWFCGAASEARATASPLAALYADAAFAPVKAQILARAPVRPERLSHAIFQRAAPSLVVDEVEALWAPIAEADDWSAYAAKLAEIEALRLARWG